MSRSTAYVLWLFLGPPVVLGVWALLDPALRHLGVGSWFALYAGLMALPTIGHELGRDR